MRTTLTLLSLLFLACGPAASVEDADDDPIGDDDPDQPADDGACSKMDILFVVDDSLSMEEEQENLAANFPAFIDLIHNHRNVDGELLDYRIGLTTTGRDVRYKLPIIGWQNDKGDDGALVQTCGMSRRWVERNDPNVASTFACAADVGLDGPSLEMQLYATELAFSDRMTDGTNAGFLRNDALLAMVILTDENDCSRKDNNFSIPNDSCNDQTPLIPIAEHLAFLDNLKSGRGRWATAVIAGPEDCESNFGQAWEATRLKQFVTETGANGVFSSICDGDLTNGLQSALATFAAACDALPPVE